MTNASQQLAIWADGKLMDPTTIPGQSFGSAKNVRMEREVKSIGAMPATLTTCPACNSTHTVKNGKIHNGKQNFRCRECGRQFVQDPQNNRHISSPVN